MDFFIGSKKQKRKHVFEKLQYKNQMEYIYDKFFPIYSNRKDVDLLLEKNGIQINIGCKYCTNEGYCIEIHPKPSIDPRDIRECYNCGKDILKIDFIRNLITRTMMGDFRYLRKREKPIVNNLTQEEYENLLTEKVFYKANLNTVTPGCERMKKSEHPLSH